MSLSRFIVLFLLLSSQVSFAKAEELGFIMLGCFPKKPRGIGGLDEATQVTMNCCNKSKLKSGALNMIYTNNGINQTLLAPYCYDDSKMITVSSEANFQMAEASLRECCEEAQSYVRAMLLPERELLHPGTYLM